LAGAGINIHALSIADTTDFGIMRMIVSDSEKAKEALKASGFAVKTTDVVGVALTHKPGSLAGVLTELERESVSIEYMYAFTSQSTEHEAIVVFRLSEQDEAVGKLRGRIEFVADETIARLNG